MRIAQIAPPWIAIPPQQYGGVENVIYHLVEELVVQGHDVTLLAPGDARTSARHVSFIPRSLIVEGVPWQANLKAYYHLHKALEYVTAHNFDIVHSHLSSSTDMYLFPLSTSLATPHVTTLHSQFPFDKGPEHWVGDADAHFMGWSSAMRFIAPSENLRCQQQLPLTFAGVVHYGIPAEQYYRAEVPRGDYFLWMGQLMYEKGPHLAIEAARKAGVPLILAGSKEYQDREAMYYFQHMIEPYLDSSQIQFVGMTDATQKCTLLNGARALLHPFTCEEPSGIGIIEAMACGCPVISFDRGVATEIIAHEKTGYLARNLQDMVNAIAMIDTLHRPTIRRTIERRFSARKMAENYLHIYKQVIGEYMLNRHTEPLEKIKEHNHQEVTCDMLTA